MTADALYRRLTAAQRASRRAAMRGKGWTDPRDYGGQLGSMYLVCPLIGIARVDYCWERCPTTGGPDDRCPRRVGADAGWWWTDVPAADRRPPQDAGHAGGGDHLSADDHDQHHGDLGAGDRDVDDDHDDDTQDADHHHADDDDQHHGDDQHRDDHADDDDHRDDHHGTRRDDPGAPGGVQLGPVADDLEGSMEVEPPMEDVPAPAMRPRQRRRRKPEPATDEVDVFDLFG